MSINEKVAYLKGLAEGLELGTETKEGKLIAAIIDTLAVMAAEIEEINENALDIGEELDALSDDLAEVEDLLFDDDFDDDDDYDDFLDFDDDDEDDEDDDDDDDVDDDSECGCEHCKGSSFMYEVECPSCGADIALTEADLMQDSVKCAACGEELEFDFEDIDDGDEDGE